MIASQYRCVDCGSRCTLVNECLACEACASCFPIIGGIPVLMHRPAVQIASFRASIASAQHRAERVAQQAERNRGGTSTSSISQERLRRASAALTANARLLRQHAAPIFEYFSRHPLPEPSVANHLARSAAGWSPEELLPYFYQDWAVSEHFSVVKQHILSAVEKYCEPDGDVAVLGAGACGLVYALADRFETVYGVDLALEALLLASALLAGDGMTLHLQEAAWRPATIQGVTAVRPNIRLVAADANALPFESGSLSAVVTQYLLDLVNPLRLADEVRRVLAPGGVWLNFSNPMRLFDEPRGVGRPCLDEARNILQSLGFEVCHAKLERFSLVNMELLDPQSKVTFESTQFFVARKVEEPAAGSSRIAHGSVGEEDWWTLIPSFYSRYTPRVLLEKSISAKGVRTTHFISTGTTRPSVEVDEATARLFEAAISLIDSQRTVLEIYDALEMPGTGLCKVEFRQFIEKLARRDGVIELRRSASDQVQQQEPQKTAELT